jgi:lipopolysaccharide biosynthesis glycosyltransferase
MTTIDKGKDLCKSKIITGDICSRNSKKDGFCTQHYNKRFAYVGMLYGSNEYFLGALVMGYTLMKTKSPFDKILLVAPDVNDKIIDMLSNYFIVKKVDYVYTLDENFLSQGSRFKEIFTKLQALNLNYEKILMLDLDMFILHNLDHLFELNAPAAMIRSKDLPFGEKIPSRFIKQGEDKIYGGINAGLMLLEPSKKEFDEIVEEISKPLPYKLLYPEQDYLSLRYKDKWTNIDNRYNYQFTKEGIEKFNYSVHDIYILHYSWILNPWELILSNAKKVNFLIDETVEDRTYYDLWVSHYNILKRIHKTDFLYAFEYSNNMTSKITKLYKDYKEKSKEK